jgi:X-linked retinitis pigmentosa GTPase regulator
MAKKKKEVELKEVSRTEINGAIIIKYEDGSVKIIPAPIMLSAEEAEDLFGSESDDEEEEEEEEESDDDDDDSEEEESDDDDDDSEEEEEEESDDDDEEDDDDDSEEEEEEEELTGEELAEMDFEELEDVCDDKDLETDPDDYDEDDIEKLRKAIAKELGLKLPAKKEAKGKGKKGKK